MIIKIIDYKQTTNVRLWKFGYSNFGKNCQSHVNKPQIPAFGREGDVQLEELSRTTGGRSYFTDPKAPNSIIQDAFIAELQKDEDHAYPIVSLKKPIGISVHQSF